MNTNHQIATSTNEARTAAAASASPNQAGFTVISTFSANSKPPPR